MRRALALMLVCAALAPVPVLAKRIRGNTLIKVVSPTSHGAASAHPFVNVVLAFGSEEGTPDPSTFKARLGGVDITPLFEPVLESGKLVGLRASLSPALLIVGKPKANRLRIDVRGKAGKRRLHDIDRLRFTAGDTPDQPPVANALPSTVVVLPNVPTQFSAAKSTDPEADDLTYRWDFGDGSSSTEKNPVHVFGPDESALGVRLTVSDGQLESAADVATLVVPSICPTCVPGLLNVDGTSALEFGGVPVGGNRTHTFTVRNTSEDPASELHVLLGTSSPDFALDQSDVDLHAGESADVTLTFAPTGSGHESSEVTMVASASNQKVVQLLAHGYAGAAPGTGPIPTADPAFWNGSFSTQMLMPSGARIGPDDTVHTCFNPSGPGTGDYCLTDADCSVNGGTCPATGSCIRGDRAGLACSTPADCPGANAICSSAFPYGAVDMCGDGEGGVLLLSDDGTFFDQSDSDAELSETLMHLHLDGNGNRTGAEIIARLTSGTTQMTCDAIPTSQGGQAYLAEYRAVTSPSNCFRDAREALVARKKTNGADTTLMNRIDAAENLPDCEDYDPLTDLHVTPTGAAAFGSLPNTGLWRIRPTPLQILTNFDDFFQVHPDGSLIVVRASDSGLTGLLSVYSIAPDQALTGALNVSDLTPCATVQVPNNGGRTLIDTTYAVDRVVPGSLDGTILVSFAAFGGGSSSAPVIAAPLLVRGTVAFSAPAASDVCPLIGFVNLELMDDVSF
jgi:hypothetical protein